MQSVEIRMIISRIFMGNYFSIINMTISAYLVQDQYLISGLKTGVTAGNQQKERVI